MHRLLKILLFLLLATASLMFAPCAVRSSFTLSIQFFGCLPFIIIYLRTMFEIIGPVVSMIMRAA